MMATSPPRGFTLLEVMIAVALLGIGLVAVVSLSSSSVRLATASKDLRLHAEFALAVDAALELPVGQLREDALRDAKARFSGLEFKLDEQLGPHPSVLVRTVLIYGLGQKEPVYRFIRFTEVQEP